MNWNLLLTDAALQRLAFAAVISVFAFAILIIASGRAPLPAMAGTVHHARKAVSRRAYRGRHHLAS